MHTFLLRHVYASTMSSYKLTKQSAMFVTFLVSAAAHELVMAIVTQKIRCVSLCSCCSMSGMWLIAFCRFYLFALQVRNALDVRCWGGDMAMLTCIV